MSGTAELPGSVGKGIYPYSSTTPGTPGLGFPAVENAISGQPGGTLQRTIPGAHIDPTTGQPEMLTGPGGIVEKARAGFNPLSILTGNPFWRGAIAAGGVMTPTPAETGEYNPPMITGRPDAPWNTTHGLPAPAAAPQRGMPWPDTGVAPAGGGGAPVAAAGGRGAPVVAAPTMAAAPARNPFVTIDRPNMRRCRRRSFTWRPASDVCARSQRTIRRRTGRSAGSCGQIEDSIVCASRGSTAKIRADGSEHHCSTEEEALQRFNV